MDKTVELRLFEDLAESRFECPQVAQIDAKGVEIFVLQSVCLTATTDAGNTISLLKQAFRDSQANAGTGAGHQRVLALIHASHRGDSFAAVCVAAKWFRRIRPFPARVQQDN